MLQTPHWNWGYWFRNELCAKQSVYAATFVPAQLCFIFADFLRAFDTVHPGAWRFNSAKLSLITFYAYDDRPALSTGRLIHRQCSIIKATIVLKTWATSDASSSFSSSSSPPSRALSISPLFKRTHYACALSWSVQFGGWWGIMTYTLLALNPIIGKELPLLYKYSIKIVTILYQRTFKIGTSSLIDSYISKRCLRANLEAHYCFS